MPPSRGRRPTRAAAALHVGTDRERALARAVQRDAAHVMPSMSLQIFCSSRSDAAIDGVEHALGCERAFLAVLDGSCRRVTPNGQFGITIA